MCLIKVIKPSQVLASSTNHVMLKETRSARSAPRCADALQNKARRLAGLLTWTFEIQWWYLLRKSRRTLEQPHASLIRQPREIEAVASQPDVDNFGCMYDNLRNQWNQIAATEYSTR